jgi:flagellar biosynthesis/type III secretory pathway chaperone
MKADTDKIKRRSNMEKFADKIEKVFQEKFLVYKELKKVLEQEKNFITDMDVDSLWKMTDKKKQLALEIERIRGRILYLLEENNIPVNMNIDSFNLTRVIDCLPFSAKIKADLKKVKVTLNILKAELAGIASENKRYTKEYLSVINDIFATITSSENRELYSNAGMVLRDKAKKYLIKAEV